ncbi:hypothetical protein [Citreimonas salinaria]|uniref:hypothetical protein n=1 Tax=Citreimonas salinaria TaxID=321339 RepID=UPI00115FD1D0|nr:hypothetical protein [Citreimonas salinaria]
MDNHDSTRAPTRCGWEDNPDPAVLALAALTCLRGASLQPRPRRPHVDLGHAVSGEALDGHGFGCNADETGFHLPAWGAWLGRPPGGAGNTGAGTAPAAERVISPKAEPRITRRQQRADSGHGRTRPAARLP